MKSKNKKGLKKVSNIIKKSLDDEKRKKDIKKKKQQSKPKGVGAKRLGMVAFWLLFGFMILVVFVNLFNGGSAQNSSGASFERNKLLDHEGIEFAKSFVHDYFNWTTDKHGKDRLENNLKPYFLNGIDSLGGIIYNREWSSFLDKRDIHLMDIQELGSNRVRYVFKVKLTMKSETDLEDTEIDWEKLSFHDVLAEEEKVQVIDGYKVKTTEKYISVPVYYSVENNKFAIYDLPSFTFVNEERLDESMKSDLSKLRTLSDIYAENNINAFLDTFFESYSKDTRDKLSYILEDERHQDGLAGTMEYSSIKNSRIYLTDDNHNRFIVSADVILQEPTTGNEFMSNYLVVVKRSDQRYVVESLNDEKYVSELVKKYISEKESDGNQKENTNNNEENISEESDDKSENEY